MRCLHHRASAIDDAALRGQENLYAAAFAQQPEERPLPVAISAIDDPQNLTHYLNQQAQHIRQMIA